jgi:hypothetical protein
MSEPPIGFSRLTDAVDLLRSKLPPEADVQRIIATACVQGKLSAAYRRWDGGADSLNPQVWQLPHWRSYFATGIIRLELPLIDAKGRPVPDGRTAPNCEREIFVDEAMLTALADELSTATAAKIGESLHRPSRGPKAGVQLRVVTEMMADLRGGRKTRDQLHKQPEKALASDYRASRDTVRKARVEVLSVETVSKQPSANDK